MRKLLVVPLVAVLGIAALGVGIASAHKVTHDTSVTLKYESNTYGDKFFGKVSSDVKSCAQGRKITVTEDSTGDEVGEATSGDDTKYSIELSGFASPGDYTVKVKKETLKKDKKHDHTCAATETDLTVG